MAIIVFFLLPFLLGTTLVKYMNKDAQTLLTTFISGWVVVFALFEVVAVPFILLQRSFSELSIVFSALVFLLAVVSVINIPKLLNSYRMNLIDFFKVNGKIDAKLIIGWIVVSVMIAVQAYIAFAYEYYDGDDAYYVATAVITKAYDSMYLVDCYTGYTTSLDLRHALSPVPIYQAWASSVTGIHPTVIAHSILSVIWLIVMYVVFGLISKRLFIKNKEYRPVFMMLIVIWFGFGNISLFTAETFALTRTWQGKGLFAGILIPIIFLCLLEIIYDDKNKGAWLLLICTGIACVFATSVSIMLVPTLLGLSAIAVGFYKKNVRMFVGLCLSSAPCIVAGLIYIILR